MTDEVIIRSVDKDPGELDKLVHHHDFETYGDGVVIELVEGAAVDDSTRAF